MKKLKRPVPGQIVVVDWVDIYTDNHWLNAENRRAFEPIKARSVGIVLSCDRETLKLAHNMLMDGQSDISAYPIGVIRNIKVVSNVKTKV
jgi:hypothetical protein